MRSRFKPSTTGNQALSELAVVIREADEAVTAAGRRGLECALEAGEVLLKAKEQALAAGQLWLPYLKFQCRVSEDRAERYMKLARNRAKLDSASLRNPSVDAALRFLKSLEPKNPRKSSGAAVTGSPTLTKVLKTALSLAKTDPTNREIVAALNVFRTLLASQGFDPDCIESVTVKAKKADKPMARAA
jgi:hypothetical protein